MKVWVSKYPYCCRAPTPVIVHPWWTTNTVSEVRHGYFINPRLTGGGGVWRPPLPNIRDSSKTNSAIDVKLGRPSHTTILHRPWNFFLKSVGNFWDMVDFVTSLHATFGRKLAKLRGSVEDAVFNENANGKHQRRKMRRSTRWLSRFFKILGFWPLKFKKSIFLENDP